MVVRASDNGPARRPQRWTLHSIPIDESVVAAAPGAPELEPDPEAEAGARVLGGRYVLLELLCHGELGGVYLGRDRLQNRSIEVKLLSPSAAASAPAVAQLRSRARRMFGIRHANVASVYDEALDEDNLPFFVTEHVEGRNLHHMQGDPRLTVAAVQAIAHQLAQALATVHGRSVVHGAVTPGNVVWLEDEASAGQIKLVDREVSPADGVEAGAALGMQSAHGYRPPGAGAPDEAGDVYALGAVVYELCTGRLPWTDPDQPPRMRGDDVPIAVPEAFEAIILDLVSPDPTARSAGANALIERLVAAGAVAAPPPRQPAPPRQPEPEEELDADAWLEPDPSEMTRFRPIEDGPPTPTPSRDLPPEPPEPGDDFFTQPAAAAPRAPAAPSRPPPPRPPSAPTARAAATPSAIQPSATLPPGLLAQPGSGTTASPGRAQPSGTTLPPGLLTQPGVAPVQVGEASIADASAVAPLTPDAALAARRAAQRAARAEYEKSLRTWRIVGGLIIAALLIVLIWQLSSGKASAPAEPTGPADAPAPAVTSQREAPPPAPILARTTGPDPARARAVDPEPTPTDPAVDPAPPSNIGDRPEQLSAADFRKVLLRANRLVSTRSCYRKHTDGSDRSVEIIAIVSPEGRVQKLRVDPDPLADCLRKVVLGLDFPSAQKQAQHIFVFHHPDVVQSG